MSATELLGRVVPLLQQAGLEFMIAGSFASTYHGEPRTTHDIDIVIDGSLSALETFVTSLDSDTTYVDLDVARDAHTRRGNIVDMTSGWKVDFIVRKNRPFSVEEFQRRQPARLLGCDVFVATAEDTIVAKLDWARDTSSERQLQDVASIIAVSGDALDQGYVDRWIGELGLAELWAKATSQC